MINNVKNLRLGKLLLQKTNQMKYTKFFSGYINSQGSPNLQPDQFKQLMNLVHLEGQLMAIDKTIEKFKNIESPHKYEMLKTPIIKHIDEVSKGLSPSELLESWSE
jgi:hypothetical protein